MCARSRASARPAPQAGEPRRVAQRRRLPRPSSRVPIELRLESRSRQGLSRMLARGDRAPGPASRGRIGCRRDWKLPGIRELACDLCAEQARSQVLAGPHFHRFLPLAELRGLHVEFQDLRRRFQPRLRTSTPELDVDAEGPHLRDRRGDVRRPTAWRAPAAARRVGGRLPVGGPPVAPLTDPSNSSRAGSGWGSVAPGAHHRQRRAALLPGVRPARPTASVCRQIGREIRLISASVRIGMLVTAMQATCPRGRAAA